MYDRSQLRRDASQLEIDLHDLARRVDTVFPDRYDIGGDLRSHADRIAPLIREIQQLTQGEKNG